MATELRELAAGGTWLRHRGRNWHGEDARHPPDRRGHPARRSAARRCRQPRARSDARDADLERHHRDHRHRAALVPGRRHPPDRHAGRRRDPSDIGRAGAVPRARQARGLPVHLAVGHGGSALLCALPRTPPRSSRARRSIPRRRRTRQASSARIRWSFSTTGSCATSCRSGAASACSCRRAPRSRRRRQRRRAVPADHGRVLSRRRADPRDPAVPRGNGAPKPYRPRDDCGGPERAQRARASTPW